MTHRNHLQDSGAGAWHYFIVMIDHGRKGREAVVDPELTRRNIVERVQSDDYPRDRIIFIHEVCDGVVSDVTQDILALAGPEPDVPPTAQDAYDWLMDYQRDQRKQERV